MISYYIIAAVHLSLSNSSSSLTLLQVLAHVGNCQTLYD